MVGGLSYELNYCWPFPYQRQKFHHPQINIRISHKSLNLVFICPNSSNIKLTITQSQQTQQILTMCVVLGMHCTLCIAHWNWRPGLSLDILKIESWTHMGRTANIIIKYVIHVSASISKIMRILLMGRHNRERWKQIYKGYKLHGNCLVVNLHVLRLSWKPFLCGAWPLVCILNFVPSVTCHQIPTPDTECPFH